MTDLQWHRGVGRGKLWRYRCDDGWREGGEGTNCSTWTSYLSILFTPQPACDKDRHARKSCRLYSAEATFEDSIAPKGGLITKGKEGF